MYILSGKVDVLLDVYINVAETTLRNPCARLKQITSIALYITETYSCFSPSSSPLSLLIYKPLKCGYDIRKKSKDKLVMFPLYGTCKFTTSVEKSY